MQEITLSVILRGVLGLGPDAGRLRMRPLIERLMASLLRPAAIFATMALPLVGGLTPYARFRRAVEELDAALYFEIRQRRGSEGVDGRADLLSLMLTARYEDGKPMSDEEVRDELITLIVAGFETTAVVLSWSFEKLLTHPEALRRLIAELIEVVGQRPLRPEDLPHLTYLDGCINEAMRLHPLSVIGARITRKDVEIDGIEIPARTCVVPCMYLAHRRPDAYPNPEAFEPERWRNKQPDPASFFPFGGGYRRCIGAEFSLQEIKIVLAHALSRCDLEPTPGPRPAPRAHGVLLAPGGGCPIVVAHKRPDLGTRGV
jgi:unspecific monooxygenase